MRVNVILSHLLQLTLFHLVNFSAGLMWGRGTNCGAWYNLWGRGTNGGGVVQTVGAWYKLWGRGTNCGGAFRMRERRRSRRWH